MADKINIERLVEGYRRASAAKDGFLLEAANKGVDEAATAETAAAEASAAQAALDKTSKATAAADVLEASIAKAAVRQAGAAEAVEAFSRIVARTS